MFAIAISTHFLARVPTELSPPLDPLGVIGANRRCMQPIKYPVMIGARPMVCPECSSPIHVRDLRGGRCPRCGTRIQISRRFRIVVGLAMAPSYLMIVLYGFFIVPSRSNSDILIILSLVGSAIAALSWWALAWNLAFWLTPPKIERDVGNPVRLDLS